MECYYRLRQARVCRVLVGGCSDIIRGWLLTHLKVLAHLYQNLFSDLNEQPTRKKSGTCNRSAMSFAMAPLLARAGFRHLRSYRDCTKRKGMQVNIEHFLHPPCLSNFKLLFLLALALRSNLLIHKSNKLQLRTCACSCMACWPYETHTLPFGCMNHTPYKPEGPSCQQAPCHTRLAGKRSNTQS